MTEPWTDRTDGSAGPGRARETGAPGLARYVLGLWRAKWLMILVFLPIFALGLAIAMTLPTKYASSSRLYVALGEEYVYRPRVGGEAAGAIPDIDQVIQAELELLRSPVVAERVLRRFGLRQLYPDIAAAYEAAPADERAMYLQRGVDALQRDFGTGAAPKTPVITTTFRHEDPNRAAEVLNAMIGAYLKYRSEIFLDGGSDGLTDQRRRFEADLLQADAELQRFLAENDISSFEPERDAARALYATVNEELVRAEARLRAARGEVSVLRQQVSAVTPEIDLFVEDRSAQSLRDLEIEREDLLSRYTPDSQPVRAIDQRIAQLEAYLGNGSETAGLTRRGPNPVYQSLAGRLAEAETQAEALSRQTGELRAQRDRVETRLAELTRLEPRYEELIREKSLIARNLETYAAREVEEKTLRELALRDTDNIRILEAARPAARGSSLKKPVAILAFLFAGFTALIVGSLKALTSRAATRGRLQAEAGVPVFSVPRKPRP